MTGDAFEMRCDRVTGDRLVDDVVDDEVAAHLRGCHDCAHRREEILAIASALREAERVRAFEFPAEVDEAVEWAIRDRTRDAAAPLRPARPLPGGLVAVAASLLLVVMGALLFFVTSTRISDRYGSAPRESELRARKEGAKGGVGGVGPPRLDPVRRLEGEVAALRGQLERQRKETAGRIEELVAACQRLQREYEAMARALADGKAELTAALGRVKGVEEELARARLTRRNLSGELAAARSRQRDLGGRLERARAREGRLARQLKEAGRKLAAIEKEREKERKEWEKGERERVERRKREAEGMNQPVKLRRHPEAARREALALCRVLARGEPVAYRKELDANRDGKIDVGDALLIALRGGGR